MLPKELMLEMYKAGKLEFDETPSSFFLSLFNMPPVQALKYLRKRGDNLITADKWKELDNDAHWKAFTVAKVTSADILQDIYDMVLKAKSEGLSSKEFKKGLSEKLETKGWSGSDPSRAEIIYRTNIQTSYASQRYKEQLLVQNKYPMLRYMQIQRPTKNHDHSKYHNHLFRVDDPNLGSIYAPSDYGCLCSLVQLSESEAKELGLPVMNAPKTGGKIDVTKEWKPDMNKYAPEISKALKKDLEGSKKDDRK